MKYSAIITAGGTSSRYGNKNKLLEKINNQEVIKLSADHFLNHEQISEVIICAHSSIIEELKAIFNNPPKLKIVEGGATRQQSVYNGLCATDADYVLIHDGARPIISKSLIDSILETVQTQKALTVATKTTDTIKYVENNKIIKTLDRSFLYNTQTPQAFEYRIIKDAHEKLKSQVFSDDAGMDEALNIPVYILENDYKNIKITTQNDLDIAKVYLNTL